jgi:hypothetical protein
MSQAKMVGSVLLKRGVMGYVIVDFMVYKDRHSLRLLGYDVRINAYPSLMIRTDFSLRAGFNEKTGTMIVLKNVGDASKCYRWVVIQNAVDHPGMGGFAMKEIRKMCFGQGMFFDLLTRTGFKLVFFESPSKARNFALTSALSPQAALKLMEKKKRILIC